MMRATAAVALCLVAASGCGEQRAQVQRWEPRYTYLDHVGPLLTQRCVGCHRGATARGSYRLDSWSGLLGPGSDLSRNAVAGDAGSQLLKALGSAKHAGLLTSGELTLLKQWVVDDKLAYFRSGYHPAGWLYPADRDARSFHGGELRALRWDVSSCRQCHGADLAGGRSSKSCKTCHAKGPFSSCTTCHGALTADGRPPPDLSWKLHPATARGVGSHQAHASARVVAPLLCGECHAVPQAVFTKGHLFDDGARRTTDLRAELRFGGRALLRGAGANSYDRKQGKCTVYCHGSTLKYPGTTPRPAWLQGDRLGCGSCHQVPHKGMGVYDCGACHQRSVTTCAPTEAGCLAVGGMARVKFRGKGLHLDGKAPVGRSGDGQACDACHGTAASAGAPAPDLHGNSSTSAVSVGLHKLHLADGAFRVKLTCKTCHQVPTKLGSPGHVDSALPAEVVFNDLASGKRRDPGTTVVASWDHKTGTCNNVYCHSRPTGKVGASWSWTKKLPQGLVCDSCHKGKPQYPLTYCKVCHPAAYKDGKLDPSKHINGKMDFAL